MNHRDVDALVAAEVPAVVRVPVARVPDDEPSEDDRTARIPEARASTRSRVVFVAVRLEELARQLLSDLGRVPTDDGLAHRGRELRARVGFANLGPVPDRQE